MSVQDITIDILLATYNGSAHLREQIDSLQKQTHVNWRLWVRDDSSNDNTVEILNREKLNEDRIKLISESHNNQGPGGSFSWLIENIPNDAIYIMFCDQDDNWHPDKISKTLNKMLQMTSKHKETPLLVHTDLVVVDESLNLISPSFWRYQHLDVKCKSVNRLMVQNNITGCTMMMNRMLVDMALPVPGEAMMHDWWIGLVCSVFGEIGVVDEALIDYRQHTGNDTGAKKYLSNFKISKVLGYLYYMIKHSGKCSDDVMLTVKQMNAFKLKYKSSIPSKHMRLINGFTHMGEYNIFLRKYFILRYRVLRQGIVRNIGLLLSV